MLGHSIQKSHLWNAKQVLDYLFYMGLCNFRGILKMLTKIQTIASNVNYQGEQIADYKHFDLESFPAGHDFR